MTRAASDLTDTSIALHHSAVSAIEVIVPLAKRMWCLDCQHFCPTDHPCSCAISGHACEWATPAGAALFARVVRIVSQVGDAEEAALLSREAALKLGFDATQLWIEAQRLAASRRRR
jgi:hypothetical protein